MQPEIIFEDHYLLVLNKPCGMVSEGNLESAEDWVYDYVSDQKRQKNNFLQLMHRLDKPASGILLFAKTAIAAKLLQKQIEERQIDKFYLCLVKGNATNLEPIQTHYLTRDEKGFISIVVPKEEPGSKIAQLEILDAHYNDSLNETFLKIKLITGRYHQIRCQLAHLGFPVVGDGLYATEIWNSYRDIALHAVGINCEHPKTLEKLEIKNPPKDPKWNAWEDFWK